MKKPKELKIIHLCEYTPDFAIKYNCGYTLDEIKTLLLAEKGYDLLDYNIRIGYVRFIWETTNVGTYEYPELEASCHYEEFKQGGRGAMKVYIFEETQEACKRRWERINKQFQRDYESEDK